MSLISGYGINIPADPFRNSGSAGAAADFWGITIRNVTKCQLVGSDLLLACDRQYGSFELKCPYSRLHGRNPLPDTICLRGVVS